MAVLRKSQDARFGWLHGRGKAQFRQDMSRTWKNPLHVIQATCMVVMYEVFPLETPTAHFTQCRVAISISIPVKSRVGLLCTVEMLFPGNHIISLTFKYRATEINFKYTFSCLASWHRTLQSMFFFPSVYNWRNM
jgi:hypothetical protein